MPGSASQRPAQPSTKGMEKAAIQGLRAPVRSAMAPSGAARIATVAPAIAAAAPQSAWPATGSPTTEAAK
jgi:hypothetical protein